MRHRVNTVKLNRTSSHRKAMFRNMVTSLFKHDKIRTTDAKAKELRRWADHLITLAKRGDLHSRRQALAIIREKAVVHKLFAEAEDRFGSVSGGYTRIIKIGTRAGDAASVSFIELVSKDDEKPEKVKKKKIATNKTTPDVAADSAKTKEAGTDQPSEKVDEAVVEASATETPAEESTAAAEEEAAEDSEKAEVAAAPEEVAKEADSASEDTPTEEDTEEDKDKEDPEKKED